MSITHKKQAQIYTQQMIQMDKTKSVVHSGQVQMQVAGAINNASTAMGVINQQIQNTNITSSINQFQEQERKLNEMYIVIYDFINLFLYVYRNEGMQQAMGTDNCYQEEDINQYMMNMQAMAAVDLAPRAAIGVPAAYQQPAYQQPVLAQPYGQPQQQQQPPQYQYQPPPQQQQQQYGQLNPPPFQPQQQQPPSAYPPPQFNPGMGGGTGVTGGVAPSLDDLERRLNNLAK